MRKRRLVSLLLIGSLILSLAGCAGQTQDVSSVEYDEEIELIEPENAKITYEVVQRRTLRDISVNQGAVLPYIEEYKPPHSMVFPGYNVFFGQTVKKGEELFWYNSTEIDKEIKAMEENIESMQKDYEKYVEDQNKLLEKHRSDQGLWKYYVDINEENEPPKTLLVPAPQETEGEPEESQGTESAQESEGTQGAEGAQGTSEDSGQEPQKMIEVENPEHVTWQEGYDMVTGRYRISKHAADTIELQLAQRKDLYELDLKHQKYLLEQKKKERGSVTMTSGMDGMVVALASNYANLYNYWIYDDRYMAAVADLNRKVIKSAYITKVVYKQAKDVYALIDGKRYEVEYHELSSDEYNAMLARKQAIYSEFSLADKSAEAEVEVGDYVVIVVVNDIHEDIVTISKDALHVENGVSYVYRIQNGQTVYTEVQTGYTDGNFYEVTQGLSEGDYVLCKDSIEPGSKTATLKKGDFYTEVKNRPEVNFSYGENLTNPIQYGTTYFLEYHVDWSQHVEKGDLIATVRVVADELGLRRNEKSLKRLNDRLADYMEENKKYAEEDFYIEAVKNYQKSIEELQELIAQQKADFATTEIRADRSGVVAGYLTRNPESILRYGESLVRIADDASCYLKMTEENQLLQIGNRVKVELMDSWSKPLIEVEGMVVSANMMGVNSDLLDKKPVISIPKEGIAALAKAADEAGVPWVGYGARYQITVQARSMENVVLLPHEAVYLLNNKTYVYVRMPDGSVQMQSIAVGGSDKENYWVVEGLTEGTEVCLK